MSGAAPKSSPARGSVVRPRSSKASFTTRALVLAVICAGLLLAVAVPGRAWFAQRAQIASLRADVDAAEARVSELQVEKQRWSDPSFVAAEARRRLHFVLPGEVGYVTLGADGKPLNTEAEAASTDPWYSELWGALQQADDRGAD